MKSTVRSCTLKQPGCQTVTKHELKVHPEFWDALKRGQKPFEVRRNDRNYQVGDLIELRLYDPSFGYVAGELVSFFVTYVLKDFDVGLKPGFVVLGFGNLPNQDDGK